MALALTTTGADPTDIERLRASLRGELIGADDAGYDEARQVWNAAIDRRPAFIVRAADAVDVAQVVCFARQTGLDLTVRSGGHSFAGYGVADGAAMIDMSAMRGLHMDPEARLAWAQAGLTAGEYTAAAAEHGLATPFGDVPTVGIAGLTLGGGIGWLVRKHGLTIDSLVAVELVTAEGRIVTASADENQDLFWAIRGGGGNFGIVTRFQYRLHPVSMVLGGALFLPFTAAVLRGLVPAAQAAPEDLTTITMVMPAPPVPFVPQEMHGKLAVVVMVLHAGDFEEGQRALEPFRALATPIADAIMPMPYPAIYEMTRHGGERSTGVHRSLFLEALDDGAVEAIVARMNAAATPQTMFQVRVLGGAMARVDADDTAFAHRDAAVLVTIMAGYEDPADRGTQRAWADGLLAEISGRASGVYANFLEAEGDARVREAYPTATYDRLAAIKLRYDPTNFFHHNQNIQPGRPLALLTAG